MDRIILRQLSRDTDNEIDTKTSPLTSTELDGNFLFVNDKINSVVQLTAGLNSRITTLENAPGGGNGGSVDLSNYYTRTEVDALIPTVFSGDYNDLTNKPTIPTPFSGNYVDLTNKPTIPSDINELTDADGLLNSGGGSGGVSLTRSTASVTTQLLAAEQVELINITNAAKSYAIMSIETTGAAWVRLYSTDAARTADSSRLENQDPDPGSGVLAEIITTSAGTVAFTPATIGFNNENTPVNTIYMSVTNRGTTAASITVDLTFLPLEI